MSNSNPLHDAIDEIGKQPVNPYAAPAGHIGPERLHIARKGAVNASQNRRFVNFIVDGVLIRLVSWVAIRIVFSAILYLRLLTMEDNLLIYLISTLLSIAILASYYIVLEGLFGVTLGKLITGTRVVNTKGGKPSFGQVVGRSFARMIPLEPFSYLLGDSTTGWHDSLSGTRVIRNR